MPSAPGADLRTFLEVLRRRWWLVAASALLAFGATWWLQRNASPVYTAEVLLEQRTETPLVGWGPGTANADFGVQVELIRSRSVAAQVLDSLGLQLRVLQPRSELPGVIGRVEVEPGAAPGPYTLLRQDSLLLVLATRPGSGDGAVEDTIARTRIGEWVEAHDFRIRLADQGLVDREPLRFALQNREVAIERLRRSIMVEPGRGPSLLRIRYTSADPEVAAAVVNAVAGAYQNQRADVARQEASRRREVIADQLVQLADSLNAAQELVVEYRRDSGLDPNLEASRLTSLVLDGETEARTLRFQESILESLLAGLSSDDGGRDESVHRILSLGSELVPAGPALHQRLQDLEIERSRLTASRFGRTEGDPQVETLDSLIASTRSQIRLAVEQGLAHLRVRLESVEQRLSALRAELGSTPGRTAELARLQQRADAVQGIVDALVNRYFEAQVAEAAERGGVAVVDPAAVPIWPNASQRQFRYLLSLMVGGLLGVVGAFVLSYMDRSVQRAADVQGATGLPLLGMIPLMRTSRPDAVTAAVGKESFRSLRTNLRFGATADPRVLSLTSATPQEGKSTVAVNLATTLAEQGTSQVLLIDADLRRPVVHQVFDLPRAPGLTDALQRTPVERAVRPSRSHSNLYVLTCGNPVRDPARVLGSREFGDLLGTLRERFDYIVVDTPPVLAVTDGMLVTKVVDGTIMVVRANQTDREAVANAMAQLRHIDATLLGVILNAVDVRSGEGRSYYRYYRSYVSDSGNGDRASRRLISAS